MNYSYAGITLIIYVYDKYVFQQDCNGLVRSGGWRLACNVRVLGQEHVENDGETLQSRNEVNL